MYGQENTADAKKQLGQKEKIENGGQDLDEMIQQSKQVKAGCRYGFLPKQSERWCCDFC